MFSSKEEYVDSMHQESEKRDVGLDFCDVKEDIVVRNT